MSSHHIIREKQEPALIIRDLDQIDTEYLGQVLEWSPTILAFESSLQQVKSLGINLDLILVHESEIEKWTDEFGYLQPLKVISYADPVEIEYSAVRELKQKGHDAINVIGSGITIERFMHLVRSFDSIDFTMISSRSRLVPIKNGVFEKWYPKSQVIEIIPANPPMAIEISGAGYPERQSKRITDTHVIETASDGIIKITADRSIFAVKEALF